MCDSPEHTIWKRHFADVEIGQRAETALNAQGQKPGLPAHCPPGLVPLAGKPRAQRTRDVLGLGWEEVFQSVGAHLLRGGWSQSG